MGIETIDFQPFVSQQVAGLVSDWQQLGFNDELVAEHVNQMTQLGMIAAQQCQQEGALKTDGSDVQLPYDEAMAGRVVHYFLYGLNTAVIKAHEQALPSVEKWQILQNVAFQVFMMAKNSVMATLGQEKTPEVQISDEQIYNYLSQNATEAFLYFLNDWEQQNGPITRLDAAPNLLDPTPEEVFEEPVAEEPVYTPEPEAEATPEPVSTPSPEPTPVAQPAVAASVAPAQTTPSPSAPSSGDIGPKSDRHHKMAAIALFLSTLPAARKKSFLSAFSAPDQELIAYYHDPVKVSDELNLKQVAYHLKVFKDKMGEARAASKSPFAKRLIEVLPHLESDRLNQLFEAERPMIKAYLDNLTSTRPTGNYHMPPGVEQSLLYYLQQHFPQVEVLAP